MSILLYNFTFYVGIYRGLCCPQFARRVRFSPFNRRIFKPRAFGFHAPRLNAAPVHVPPVMLGRFRRPPSTVAPRFSAALWPARSRVPVVGLENRPASHVLHTNSFFWIIAGGASASMRVPGLNRARRFGAGFIVCGVRLNLARRYGPRLCSLCGNLGRGPSVSLRLRSQCTRTAETLRVLRCGADIVPPSPPKTKKGIWAAG